MYVCMCITSHLSCMYVCMCKHQSKRQATMPEDSVTLMTHLLVLSHLLTGTVLLMPCSVHTVLLHVPPCTYSCTICTHTCTYSCTICVPDVLFMYNLYTCMYILLYNMCPGCTIYVQDVHIHNYSCSCTIIMCIKCTYTPTCTYMYFSLSHWHPLPSLSLHPFPCSSLAPYAGGVWKVRVDLPDRSEEHNV